jgi:hypothetical protein
VGKKLSSVAPIERWRPVACMRFADGRVAIIEGEALALTLART